MVERISFQFHITPVPYRVDDVPFLHIKKLMQILTNKQNSGFTSAVKQNLKVRIMIINDYLTRF